MADKETKDPEELTEEQKQKFEEAKDEKLTVDEKLAIIQSINLTQPQKDKIIRDRMATMTVEQKQQFVQAQQMKKAGVSPAQLQQTLMAAKIAQMSPEQRAEMTAIKKVIEELALGQELVVHFHELYKCACNDHRFQTEEEAKSGLVHEKSANALMVAMGAEEHDLEQIYAVADKHKRKALSQSEFLIAMTMIARAQQGLPVEYVKTSFLAIPRFMAPEPGSEEAKALEEAQELQASQHVLCSVCDTQLPKSKYTKTQLKNKGKRRCMDCVKAQGASKAKDEAAEEEGSGDDMPGLE